MTILAASDQEYQNLIYTTLTAVGEECVSPSFHAQICFLWGTFLQQAAGDRELLYYIVKREMIKNLMICTARAVDQRQSVINDDTMSNARLRAEGHAQMQESHHRVEFSDTLGKERFSDLLTMLRTTTSNRAGFARGYNLSWVDYDDIGSGARAGFNQLRTANTGYTDTDAARDSRGLTFQNDRKRGCSYQFSQNRTRGQQFNLVLVGFGRTATKTAWDRYMSQGSTSDGTSRTAVVGAGETHGGTDRVADGFNRYSTYLNSLTNTIQQGLQHNESFDTLTSSRDVRQHREGAGYKQEEMRANGNAHSQMDSESLDTSKSRSERHTTGHTDTEALRLSQRYAALSRMFTQAQSMVEHRQSEIVANSYAFAAMEGVCYDAQQLPTATFTGHASM